MKQRWLVVIVGLPALLAVLLACPAWATMLVVCGIAGIAAYELLHTAGENVPADFYWGLVTSVVMQEIWLFKEEMSGTYDLPISTVTIFRWILVMMAFLFAVISYGKEKPFTFHDVAVAIIGGIVFPAMYSCIWTGSLARSMCSRRSASPLWAMRCRCTLACGSASARWRRTSARTRPGRASSAVPSAAHLRCCCSA